MDTKLTKYLNTLREEAEASWRRGGSAAEIADIVNDISALTADMLYDERDAAFAVGAVFDEESGVLSIADMLKFSNKASHKARESFFNFLAHFIARIGKRALPYASLVKDKCLNYFKREDLRAVQAAILSPLIAIMEISMEEDLILEISLDWSCIERLVVEYRKAKTSGTLRSQILILSGYAIELFPKFFEEDNVHTVMKLCLDTLEEQLHQAGKVPVYILVAGSVKCIDSLLTWYPKDMPAGGSVENSRKIYAYVEQVIHFREDLRRYQMVIVGLKLLSRHARFFRIRLLEDSITILKWLQAYCTHTNSQIREVAYPAVDQFISEIASCILSGDRRVKNPQHAFKIIFSDALGLLDSTDSDARLKSLAILIMGKFSPLIIKFSGKETLSEVFHRLVPFGNLNRAAGAREESLKFSVSMVGAFSEMVVYFDYIENYMMSLIIKAVGNIFYNYPYLFPKQKQGAHTSLQKIFQAFFSQKTMFTVFVNNIVWSSLERAVEPVNDKDIGKPLWMHYAELWSQILVLLKETGDKPRKNEIKEDSDEDAEKDISDFSEKSTAIELQAHVFDCLIKFIMKLMKELNVKYIVKSIQPQECKAVEDVENDAVDNEGVGDFIEPVDHSQMSKFLNLVAFVAELLSRDSTILFLKWAYPFGRCLVDLSTRYPLVSGFYKLLSICIQKADAKGYFGDSSFFITEMENCGIEDIILQQDKDLCVDLFRKYLLEVLVACRRYKLELLLSCLGLCLSAPPVLVDIVFLVGPIISALKLGLRHCPLAMVAMDCLERWHQLQPKNLEPLFQQIIPHLNKYLIFTDNKVFGKEASIGSLRRSYGPKGLSSAVNQRKRISHEKGMVDKEIQIGSFEHVQLRVQKFLGRIGGKNHFLLHNIDLMQANGVGGRTWDTANKVKFTLPFSNVKSDIWLDSLLLRLVDISMTSSERSVKVAASELLHAITVVMVGNAAKGPTRLMGNEQHVHYEKIYQHLFPAILRLATDVELVTRQLFSVFVKQLIHWFTSNTQKENPDSMALLDAILEGVVDPENGSLREFSAQCFAEYMQWSVRHASPEVDNFLNVASLLRRLYARLDHPNPFHRLGATMAAHLMYPVLRQNESVTDIYVLEILFFCLKSLRLGENDDPNTGTVKIMTKVLEGLQKLVKRNIKILKNNRKERKGFSSIYEFLDWLFGQTGQQAENYRRKCTSLFSFICDSLPDGSSANWFKHKSSSSDNLQNALQVFDVEVCYPRRKDEDYDVQLLEEWMKNLICSVDWFAWALRENLISVDKIVSNTENKSWNVVLAVREFLQNLFNESMNLDMIASLTPMQKDSHGVIRIKTILAILSFLKMLLQIEIGVREEDIHVLRHQVESKTNDDVMIHRLVPFTEPFFVNLLCQVLFHPRKLALTMIESEIMEELLDIALKILTLLLSISPSFRTSLLNTLRSIIPGKMKDFELDPEKHLDGKDFAELKHILKSFQKLHLSGLLLTAFSKENAYSSAQILLRNLYSVGSVLPPALHPIACDILKFTISLGITTSELLVLVLQKESPNQSGMNKCSEISTGSSFYFNYRGVVIQQVKFSYKESLQILIKEAQRNYTARLLLNAILDDYLKNDSITKSSFMTEFLRNVHMLSAVCKPEAPISDKLFFLEIVQKLFTLDPEISSFLGERESLSFIINTYFSFLGIKYEASIKHASKSFETSSIMTLKSFALVLVPCFLKLSNDKAIRHRLLKSVANVVSNHLLVEESDIPHGSNERSAYIQMLERLEFGVLAGNQLELVEVVFPLFSSHVKMARIKVQEILEAYANMLGYDREDACFIGLRIINDNDKSATLRRAVLEHMLVPVISKAPKDFLISWYEKHIVDFKEVLNRHQQIHSTSEKEQDYLIVKICYYKLFELLFTFVDATVIKDRITPYAPNQQLIQNAINDSRAKNDPAPYPFTENLSLWREMHIAAYNCLSWIIMRTQDQEKVYLSLFKDFPGKPLWQNIVDCSKVYNHLPVEASTFKASYDTYKPMEKMKSGVNREIGATQSFSSQHLVGATLTDEPILINTFVQYPEQADNEREEGSEEQVVSGTEGSPLHDAHVDKDDIIENEVLDQDDFDLHPSTTVILQLIQHCNQKFISNSLVKEMPDWMKALHYTLDSSVTPINVCLFIAKIITKARKVFAPFSGYWFRPYVQAVLRDPEHSGGRHFHYMLRDVCITVLDWNLVQPPDVYVASTFVNHLISVTPHSSKLVLQANLEIISTYLKEWKDFISLDRKIIFTYVMAGEGNLDENSKHVVERYTGLKILETMASLGISVCEPSNNCSITEDDLCKHLLVNLSSKIKTLYEAAAEVLGIILRLCNDGQLNIDLKKLLIPLRESLVSMSKDGDLTRYLNIMNKVTVHHPTFLESYVSIVIDVLARVHGTFRLKALEILLRKPSLTANLYNIISPFLSKLLSHRDELAQLKSLQLVQELLKEISIDIVTEKVLPLLVEVFATHESNDCRQLFYETLIFLYKEKGLGQNEVLRRYLLLGLNDGADIIRHNLQSFWHGELAKNISERFVEIIHYMYDPDIEDCWPQIADVLLLKLCEDSVDFDRAIFNAPLSDCEFYDYTINTAWLGGTLPMTPIFTGTQGTHEFVRTPGSQILEGEGISKNKHLIRATYVPSSSLTVSQNFTFGDITRESQVPSLSENVRGSQHALEHERGTWVDRTARLRRRIPRSSDYRSQTKTGVLGALRRRESQLVHQSLERANKVQMMRRYRTGELPDIEIAYKDVILPLSALAEKDAVFARLLVLVLSQAICSQASGEYQRVEKELNLTLTKGIENALKRTKYSGPFVGCVIDLCLETNNFNINPKLAGLAARKSRNYHTGILFLENVLVFETMQDQLQEIKSKRHCGLSRRVNETDATSEAWLELVKLYKSIGESDIVLSIYKNKLAKAAFTVHAIEAQLRGETSKALQLYDKAIYQLEESTSGSGMNVTPIEQDICYDQRLQCLIDLNQWQDIMEDTLCQTKDDESKEPEFGKLWSSSIQDPYLGLFVKGSVKLTTYSSLLSCFVQQAFDEPSRRDLLLVDYSPDLATLAVISDQFDLAIFYIQKSYETFRKQWSGIHPLAIATKHLLLPQLQRIVELDEFIELAMQDNCEVQIESLLSKWRKRWPAPEFDDVEAWDDIAQNRLLYLQKFSSLITEQPQRALKSLKMHMNADLEFEKANIFFEAARGLMLRGSYDAAQGYMNQYMAHCEGSLQKDNLDFGFFKTLIKLRCLQADRELTVNSFEARKMLQQVHDYITSMAKNPSYQSQDEWKIGLKLLEGNVTSLLATVSLKSLSTSCTSPKELESCVSLFSSAYVAYSSLFSEVSNIDQFKEKTHFTSKAVAKVYLKFAALCDQLLSTADYGNCCHEIRLRLRDGDSSKGLPNSSVYPALVVKYIMKAVKLNSATKFQYGIARILTLLNRYTDTHLEFVRQLKGVPCWFFIAWIPQILAVMDKEEGAVLVSVLEDIANSYPQALYFPFNVSQADFGPIGLERTKKINFLLNNQTLKGLTRALQDLTFPEQRLQYWISHVKNCLSVGNNQGVESAFCQMFEDCLDVRAMSDDNRKSGKYNLKFAQDYCKKILNAFGENGSKLKSMDEKTFSNSIKDVMENLAKSQKNLQVGKINLISLSKWMADFDASTHSTSVDMGECGRAPVEMPGSYSSYKQPYPCLHVKLVSFDQALVCLNSKQRPKVLKMRGSDEKDHKFLVKGGEDLRLDQRIEQLFEVMNSILSRNGTCAKRRLSLRTYAVIPVSKQCGIIEFVDDTRVIDDVIKDGLVHLLPTTARLASRNEKNTPLGLLSHLRNEYHEWVKKRGGSSAKSSVNYTNMYRKVGADETSKRLNALASQVPFDALKVGISRLATSAESFLALRSQFVRSLATLSICGYIAGVGDRHLSNFLMDTKTGTLVPIDFGYSFGTGVILLPVPELVPFRLTPQFTNLLLPLDSIGLLRNDMISTLSALQSNRENISAVLDIFTHEPLVDWKNEAMRTACVMEGNVRSQACEMSSREEKHVALKIENAHRKLNLWNPADILISELHSSIHADKPYLKDLERIVRGNPEHNVRATINRSICESVQEQVDCLIDQATDSNLLGRIWEGWQPWL